MEGRRGSPVAKAAALLFASGVRTSSPEAMIADFNFGRTSNTSLGRAVWSGTLSFNPDDLQAGGLSPERMLEITLAYCQKMQLDKTQLVIVLHEDTDKPHIHIVANRVANDGHTISDSNSKWRAQAAALELVAEFKLTPAKGNRPELQNPDRVVGQPARASAHIRQALAYGLQEATSRPQLWAALATKDIAYKEATRGISFQHEEVWVKGSSVGREFSAAAIDRQLAANRERQATVAQEAEVRRQVELARQAAETFQQAKLALQAVTQASAAQEARKQEASLQAAEQKRQVELAVRQQQEQLRTVICRALDQQIPNATSMPELQQQLLRENISIRLVFQADGQLQDIVFTTAAYPGREVRSSELGHLYGAAAVSQTLARQAAEYQDAKLLLADIHAKRDKLAELGAQADQAERQGDYGRMAQLRYGDMPEVTKHLTTSEEQAAATPSGRSLLAALHAQEAAETQAIAQTRLAEQTRLTQEQAAAAALAAEQNAARRVVEDLYCTQKQLATHQKQAERAEQQGDYGQVAELRYGTIPSLSQQVAALQQQAEATASGRALLQAEETRQRESVQQQHDAQQKQQEQQLAQAREAVAAQAKAVERARAEREKQVLAALAWFRIDAPNGEGYLRLHVPVTYLPTVQAALKKEGIQLGYEWQEQTDKSLIRKEKDGVVSVNLRYTKDVDHVQLDKALSDFQEKGVDIFEQSAEKTKREAQVTQRRQFDREWNAGLHRPTQSQREISKDNSVGIS
jgi:hypothetical protein